MKKRVTIVFLLVLAMVALYLCYLIARPFLRAIVSAVIIAIVFSPVHVRLHRLLRSATVAALLSTVLVILIVIIPTGLLGVAMTKELAALYEVLSERSVEEGSWALYLVHLLEKPLVWLSQHFDLAAVDLQRAVLQRLTQAHAFLLEGLVQVVGDATTLIAEAVITVFTLFFLFREGGAARRRAMAILPLSPEQVDRLLMGISDAIISSVYGGLAVAIIQGCLMGLAFWYLALPSPILWGVATALCSLVPIVGSAAVWFPAAVLLMVNESWDKGLLLLAWGAVIVSTIDNIIRPYVMSGRVKLPTVLIFFALWGGLQVFGLIGLFVGPVVLAVTMALFSMLEEEVRAWRLSASDVPLRPEMSSLPRPVDSREIEVTRVGPRESTPILLPETPDK